MAMNADQAIEKMLQSIASAEGAERQRLIEANRVTLRSNWVRGLCEKRVQETESMLKKLEIALSIVRGIQEKQAASQDRPSEEAASDEPSEQAASQDRPSEEAASDEPSEEAASDEPREEAASDEPREEAATKEGAGSEEV